MGGLGFSEVIEIKPLQPEKANAPMDVTLLGIVTDVKPLQYKHVLSTDNQQLALKTVEKCSWNLSAKSKRQKINVFNLRYRCTISTGNYNSLLA